jgi:hypothetical protein
MQDLEDLDPNEREELIRNLNAMKGNKNTGPGNRFKNTAERGEATVEIANGIINMGVQKMQLLMMSTIFLGGLKDEIRVRVLKSGPDNIKTVLKLAREVEVILGDTTCKPKGVTISSMQD